MVNRSKINNSSIALVGPTAIGKTRLSIDLAREFNCEIVGVDSMQVYKFMDIGTAKITRDEMEGPYDFFKVVGKVDEEKTGIVEPIEKLGY